MTKLTQENSFSFVVQALGGRAAILLGKVSDQARSNVQEIGLRAGKPVSLVTQEGVFFLNGRGIPTRLPQRDMPTLGASDLAESLRRLCGYSIYSFQEELREGFLTLRGGHRVGVAGTTVVREGKITGIREVSSLNLRLARACPGCAQAVLNRFSEVGESGLLLAGPPASGKTTLLRELARVFSDGETGLVRKVALIDERGELAGVWGGVPQFDVGECCDVLSGCPKAEGILQAVRSLSPSVLICDEVGSREEIDALRYCLNMGVLLFTSIHAGSKEELLRRPQARELLETGAFSAVAMLSSRREPGTLQAWYQAGDLLAEMDRNSSSCAGRQLCRVSGVA